MSLRGSSSSDDDGDGAGMDEAMAERFAHHRRERSNSRTQTKPVQMWCWQTQLRFSWNVGDGSDAPALIHYSPQDRRHSIAGSVPIEDTAVASVEEVEQATRGLTQHKDLEDIPLDRILALPINADPIKFLKRASPIRIRQCRCIYLHLRYRFAYCLEELTVSTVLYVGGGTEKRHTLYEKTDSLPRHSSSSGYRGMTDSLGMMMLGLPNGLTAETEAQAQLRTIIQYIGNKHDTAMSIPVRRADDYKREIDHYYLLSFAYLKEWTT